MSLKHNFSGLNNFTDPFTGIIAVTNNATSGALIYVFLTLIFIVTAWAFINRTQDIAKSLLSSTHIITILTIILFYGGKIGGTVFIHEIFLYTILVIEGLGIGAIYLLRNQQ